MITITSLHTVISNLEGLLGFFTTWTQPTKGILTQNTLLEIMATCVSLGVAKSLPDGTWKMVGFEEKEVGSESKSTQPTETKSAVPAAPAVGCFKEKGIEKKPTGVVVGFGCLSQKMIEKNQQPTIFSEKDTPNDPKCAIQRPNFHAMMEGARQRIAGGESAVTLRAEIAALDKPEEEDEPPLVATEELALEPPPWLEEPPSPIVEETPSRLHQGPRFPARRVKLPIRKAYIPPCSTAVHEGDVTTALQVVGASMDNLHPLWKRLSALGVHQTELGYALREFRRQRAKGIKIGVPFGWLVAVIEYQRKAVMAAA